MARRAKVSLSEMHLRVLLDVPEDVRIVALQHRNDPMRMDIVMESDRFPELYPDSEAPIVKLSGNDYCWDDVPDFSTTSTSR